MPEIPEAGAPPPTYTNQYSQTRFPHTPKPHFCDPRSPTVCLCRKWRNKLPLQHVASKRNLKSCNRDVKPNFMAWDQKPPRGQEERDKSPGIPFPRKITVKGLEQRSGPDILPSLILVLSVLSQDSLKKQHSAWWARAFHPILCVIVGELSRVTPATGSPITRWAKCLLPLLGLTLGALSRFSQSVPLGIRLTRRAKSLLSSAPSQKPISWHQTDDAAFSDGPVTTYLVYLNVC